MYCKIKRLYNVKETRIEKTRRFHCPHFINVFEFLMYPMMPMYPVILDKFNDSSRYLDDIFTIDNPTFPRELQLNKANTSDTDTSLLDLNIKVIGYNIHTSVYDKCDDFGFPMVNFP